MITTIAYLEMMSETFIYETYQKILLSDSEKPFPEEISLENRDMFYRLKFRALNSTRSKSPDVFSEKLKDISKNINDKAKEQENAITSL